MPLSKEKINILASKIRKLMSGEKPISNEPKGIPENDGNKNEHGDSAKTALPSHAPWTDTVTGSGDGPEL